MDCKKAREFLSFYVYGELSEAEKTPVDAHLQICGECTRKLENFRVVRDALRTLPEAQVPGDFLVGVRARLDTPVTFAEKLDGFFEVLAARRLMAGASVATAAGLAFFFAQTNVGILQAPRALKQDVSVQQDWGSATRKKSMARVAGEKDLALEAEVDEVEGKAPAGIASGRAAPAAPAAGPMDRREPKRELAKAKPKPAVARRRPAPKPARSGLVRMASVDKPAPSRSTSSYRRPDPAESFDDAFGLPHRPERRVREVARPLPRAEIDTAFEASAPPPDSSPFFDGPAVMASRSLGEARDLESMGAAELAEELETLAPSRPAERAPAPAPTRTTAGEGMDIFAPDSTTFARLGRENRTAERFGGDALFDGDDDLHGGRGLGGLSAPQPAATLTPVSLAWVRSTFGRKVQVKRPDETGGEVRVDRNLGIRTRDPRVFLAGLHQLVEAGLGMDIRQVVFRQAGDVEVLLAFGGPGSLERFVEDVQALPGSELASDFSAGRAGGDELLARIVIPNATGVASR